jgi:hypothetical protein
MLAPNLEPGLGTLNSHIPCLPPALREAGLASNFIQFRFFDMLQVHWFRRRSLALSLLACDRLCNPTCRPESGNGLALDNKAHGIALTPVKGDVRMNAAFIGKKGVSLSGNKMAALR